MPTWTRMASSAVLVVAGWSWAALARGSGAATFAPDPAAHAVYDGLYERAYKPMYGRLKPLYEAIRDVTGYPQRVTG